MLFNKNNKGQGSLEYLILIGAAVMVAVIVIVLLTGMTSQTQEESETRLGGFFGMFEKPMLSGSVMSGTTPIAGATINLYVGTKTTINPSSDIPTATTTTNVQGNYEFTDKQITTSGDYTVQIVGATNLTGTTLKPVKIEDNSSATIDFTVTLPDAIASFVSPTGDSVAVYQKKLVEFKISGTKGNYALDYGDGSTKENGVFASDTEEITKTHSYTAETTAAGKVVSLTVNAQGFNPKTITKKITVSPIIKNGNFEAGGNIGYDTGTEIHWEGGGTWDSVWQINAIAKRNGIYGLNLNNPLEGSINYAEADRVRETVELQAGTYMVSGYIKNSATSGTTPIAVTMETFCITAGACTANNISVNTLSKGDPLTAVWKKVSKILVLNQASKVYLNFFLTPTPPAKTVPADKIIYVDDVRIDRVDNLISNGDFEIQGNVGYTTGDLLSWEIGGDLGTATYVINGDAKRSGASSLKITAGTKPEGSVFVNEGTDGETTAQLPIGTYTLKFYYKTAGASDEVKLTFGCPDKTVCPTNIIETLPGSSTDWTLKEKTLVLSKINPVYVLFSPTKANSIIYIDDVTLTKTS